MSLQRGDGRLQVVALLARHAELIPLDLALDTLRAFGLDELVDLASLLVGNPDVEGDYLAGRPLGRFSGGATLTPRR